MSRRDPMPQLGGCTVPNGPQFNGEDTRQRFFVAAFWDELSRFVREDHCKDALRS